jgi:NADH-quinone oxidoreductase subunit L
MGFWTMDIFNNNTYRPGEFIHPSEIGNESSYSGLISINVYVFFLQVLILSTFAINFFYASRITSYLKTVSHAAIGAFNSDKFYIEIYENVFKSLSKFIAWFDRNIVDGLINYIPLKLWGISRHLMGLQDGTARKYGIRMILFFVLLALVMGIINNIVSIGVHS